VLLDSGVYTETLFIGTGNLVLCSHFLFSGDTLDIEETVLDGQLLGTLITVDMADPSRLELNGLTLRGGVGGYDIQTDDTWGGAIDFLRAGSVYFRNLVFRENRSTTSGSAVWYMRGAFPQDPAWFFFENVNSIDNRHPVPNTHNDKSALLIAHCTSLYATKIFVKGEIGPGSMQYHFTVRDSLLIHNAEFTGIHEAESMPCICHVLNYGYAEARGIRYTDNHSFRVGSFAIYGEPESHVVARDIRIENNYYEDRYTDVDELGPNLALGAHPQATVDADSIYILNNRVENTGKLLYSNSRGELRNVFIIGNKVGSRLSQAEDYEPPTLVELRDVSLYNFVMQYDTLETRYLGPGDYVAGGRMVEHEIAHMDSAWVRKLDISNTMHIDNDVYRQVDIFSEFDTPAINDYRAYSLIGHHAPEPLPYMLLDSCSFRHNYQPNHLPEVDNLGMFPNFFVGSTVGIFGADNFPSSTQHMEITNLIMDDCDDGGIHLMYTGVHSEVRNCIITNTRRLGMRVNHSEDQIESITMSNILFQNIQQQDFYRAWPYRDSVVEQSVFKFSGNSGIVSLFSNFTITNCDMPVLMSMMYGWGNQPPILRNSIISGNTYDFFQYLQPWPSFENCIVQRPVPGDNNLIGVDPLFHPDLGPPWLSPGSPAIDAGDPDPVYYDLEDPANPGFALWPSQGGLWNDIGYTGGPAAAAMDYLVMVKPTVKEPVPTPATFTLHPAWPNPFNPSTTVSYTLARPMQVELSVYNLLGQQVRALAFGLQDAGEHSVPFTAGELASGVYVVELKAGGHSQTRKVLLLK
jgi:hypothetical protein